MMTIGSDNWFKELNSSVKFPSKFCFYLLKKDTELYITVKEIESKAKDVNNIKLGSLSPPFDMTLFSSNISILEVCDIKNENEYYDKIKKLCNKWDVELSDEK